MCAAVIQEAMASGLPVVLSSHGGNKEFITNGEEGYLIDVSSSEKKEFLFKIKQALAFKDELGRKARAKACRNFSWQRVAKKYEDFIRRT